MHYKQSHVEGSSRNTKEAYTLPIEVLTEDEARRLMDACGARSPMGLRNRALIALLYRSGLRVSEALALCPKDIDLERGIVRVLKGKNGYARTVGIDPTACEVIARWIEARHRMSRGAVKKVGGWPKALLLCTLQGGPVLASYVRVLLKRLGVKAGIAKRVHAHGLRHTMAAELRSDGVDIAVISRQLGHRSITTTARYLDHLMTTAVIDAMRGGSGKSLETMPGCRHFGTSALTRRIMACSLTAFSSPSMTKMLNWLWRCLGPLRDR